MNIAEKMDPAIHLLLVQMTKMIVPIVKHWKSTLRYQLQDMHISLSG